MGPLERQDAYCLLSLHLSCFFDLEGCKSIALRNCAKDFDIREENMFWEEIQRGLVLFEPKSFIVLFV